MPALSVVYYAYNTSTGLPDALNVNPFNNAVSLKQTFSARTRNEFAAKLPNSNLPIHNPGFILDNTVDVTSDNTSLTVTFLDEGAGYYNAFGYFVYDTESPPATAADVPQVILLFPKCKKVGDNGALSSGDSIQLAYQGTVSGSTFTPTNYLFPAGKSICWVIIANGWSNGSGTVNGANSHYFSISALNPESTASLRYHTAAVQSDTVDGMVICGFEDLNRASSDNDFNDFMWAVTPSSLPATSSTWYSAKAPVSDYGAFVCNDNYNSTDIHNDCDFNDLVGTYSYTVSRDGSGNVTQVQYTMHFTHRGSAYDHEFGVVLPGISGISDALATVRRETFVGSSGTSQVVDIKSAVMTGSNTNDQIVFVPSSRTLLPPNSGQSDLCNTFGAWYMSPTPASSVRVTIAFHTAQSYDALFGGRDQPLILYMVVYPSGTAGSGTGYSLRSDSFVDTPPIINGMEVALMRPIYVMPQCVNFQPCYEKKSVHAVYHKFAEFLMSDEQNYQQWWDSFYDINYVVSSIADPSRSWSI